MPGIHERSYNFKLMIQSNCNSTLFNEIFHSLFDSDEAKVAMDATIRSFNQGLILYCGQIRVANHTIDQHSYLPNC